MPALQNNGGDVLARGGVRATFRPMGENLSREKWDKMFKGKKEPEVKGLYIFECPVHGQFVSEREFFISGGYPLLNEYAKGKCPRKDCGEESKYAGHTTNLGPSGSNASASAGTIGSLVGVSRRRKKAS